MGAIKKWFARGFDVRLLFACLLLALGPLALRGIRAGDQPKGATAGRDLIHGLFGGEAGNTLIRRMRACKL